MNLKQNLSKKFKQKTAVALQYDAGDEAPKIIASGKGHIAERILEVANEENIPIHKDAPLTATLSKLEIGDYIPKELYEVVAEILVYVDNMDHLKHKIASSKKLT